MTIGSILGLIVFVGMVIMALRHLHKIKCPTLNEYVRKGSDVPNRPLYESDSKGSGE